MCVIGEEFHICGSAVQSERSSFCWGIVGNACVWCLRLPCSRPAMPKEQPEEKNKSKTNRYFQLFQIYPPRKDFTFYKSKNSRVSCHLFAKIFQVSSREKLGLCCEILQPHIGTHRHTLCAHLQDSKSSLNIRKWGSLNTDTLTGEARLLYFKWPLHVVSLSYNIAGKCNIFLSCFEKSFTSWSGGGT